MFRYNRNCLPSCCRIRDSKAKTMDMSTDTPKHKGGRPRQAIKREHLFGVRCNDAEKKIIQEKASAASLTVSEYLREMGLNGKIVSTKKLVPQEVLRLIGALNQNGALLNQLAKKRNSNDELDAVDRARLYALGNEYKTIAQIVRNHFT